ncbi:ubiquitin carboxyl-terminal hydrolase 7-like isoform X2 [Temnothorax nylanderi]
MTKSAHKPEKAEPMDFTADRRDLISVANKVFGEGKWNHTVVSQTLDFVDTIVDAQDKCHAGCVSFVKVQLDNGNFHEDVGYYIAEESTKGLSIQNARIGSAVNALKRVLLSFGDNIERDLQQLRRQISPEQTNDVQKDVAQSLDKQISKKSNVSVNKSGTVLQTERLREPIPKEVLTPFFKELVSNKFSLTEQTSKPEVIKSYPLPNKTNTTTEQKPKSVNYNNSLVYAEKRLEQIKRKERTEEYLYMIVNVLLEDSFDGHQGNDLYDPEHALYRVFRVRKQATVHEFLELLSDSLKYPIEQIRIWPFSKRANKTYRPTLIEPDADLQKPIIDCAKNHNPWNVFVELVPPDSDMTALPPFDNDTDVLLFFKLYDPKNKKIHYCGHHYMFVVAKVQELIPILNERAGFPPDTELALYEEICPNLIEKIDVLSEPLNDVLEELMNGDIIVFQKKLPTCQEYFKDLFYRVEVTFCDKLIPNDPGFTMELSLRMTYDQMAKAVAQRVGTDPYLLQFFKCQNYKDSPGHPLKCTFDGTLKGMVAYCKTKVKKLFYQQLSIRVNELENKKQFKCIWVGPSLKEEKAMILYPNKNGTVANLLEEAKKQVELSENGSGKLRILEMTCNKLSPGPVDDTPLDHLNTSGTKLYRIEEIPVDEVNLAEGEMLVPVAHFHKEVFSTFGIPFFFKIKHGEPFPKMKDRLLKKLGVQEKEFEKFKFAVVTMGKPQLIIDSPESCIKIEDFLLRYTSQSTSPHRPWLGLEHVNKAPKRSRTNYLEKAIKIYN